MSESQNLPQQEGINPEDEKLESEIMEDKEETLRDKVIERYGLPEDTPDEVIDRLAKDRVSFAKLLNSKHRLKEEVEKLRNSQPASPATTPKTEVNPQPKGNSQYLTAEEATRLADERFEKLSAKQHLSNMGLSEGLKQEIIDRAEFKKCLVSDVIKDGYYASKVEEETRERRNENASISGNSFGYGTSRTVNSGNAQTDLDKYLGEISKLDLTTREGVEKKKKLEEKYATALRKK